MLSRGGILLGWRRGARALPPAAPLTSMRAHRRQRSSWHEPRAGRTGSILPTTVQDDALLMKITGEDSVGITARMTELLADADAKFYDVDQLNVHNQLSLYLLTGMPTSNRQFFRKVLNKSKARGLRVDFEAVSWGDFVKPNLSALGRPPQGLVVTLLKTRLSFSDIAAVTKLASSMAFTIRKIDRVHDHPGRIAQLRIA